MKFLLVFLLLKSAICQFVVPDPGQINAIIKDKARDKKVVTAAPPPMMNMAQITNLNVDCEKSGMTVTVDFSQPFNGVIYSKGYYSDQSCRYVDANSGRGSYTFHIERGMCGAQLIEDMDRYEFTITNTIILQMDPLIQEIWDQAQKLTCSWKTRQTKHLKFRPLSISTLEAVNTQVNADGIKCWMEIMKGVYPQVSSIGDVVAIGEPLSLMVYVTNNKAPVDIAIRDCWAYAEPNFSDPTSAKLQLSSENGCILKTKLMEDWKKTYITERKRQVLLTYAKISAFKFPDEPDMHITCNIEICTGKCDQKCLPNNLSSRDIVANIPKILNSNTTPKNLKINIIPETDKLLTTPNPIGAVVTTKVDNAVTVSNINRDTTTSRIIKVTTLLPSKQTTPIPRSGSFNSNIKQNKKCIKNSNDPDCLPECFPGTSNSRCRVNCEIDPFNPSCKRGKALLMKNKERGRQNCSPGSTDPLCWNVLIKVDSSNSKFVCSTDSTNPICFQITTDKPHTKILYEEVTDKIKCQNNGKGCDSHRSSEMACILFPRSENCRENTKSLFNNVKKTTTPSLTYRQQEINCYPGSLQPECFYLSKGNPYIEDPLKPLNCDDNPYHVGCSSFYVENPSVNILNCREHGVNCNSRREELLEFCNFQPNNKICRNITTPAKSIEVVQRCKPGELCIDSGRPAKINKSNNNTVRGYCNRFPNSPSCRSQITKIPHKDIPPLICYPESKDRRCLLSSKKLQNEPHKPLKSVKIEHSESCHRGSTNPKCIDINNKGKSLIDRIQSIPDIKIGCNPKLNQHCKEEHLVNLKTKIDSKCTSVSSDPKCIAKSNSIIINRPPKLTKCSSNSRDPNCLSLTNKHNNIKITCAVGSTDPSCIETIIRRREKEDPICRRWPNIPRCRSGFIPPPPFTFQKSPCILNPNLPECIGDTPKQNMDSEVNCLKKPNSPECMHTKEEKKIVFCRGHSDINCKRITESPKLTKQYCEINPFHEGCHRLKIIDMINKQSNPLCIFGSIGKNCRGDNRGKSITKLRNPCISNPFGTECQSIKRPLEKSNAKLCERNPNDLRCQLPKTNKPFLKAEIDCNKNTKNPDCVRKTQIRKIEKCSPGSKGSKLGCNEEYKSRCINNPLLPECKQNVNIKPEILIPNDKDDFRKTLCERYRSHPLCLKNKVKVIETKKNACIPGSKLPQCLEVNLPKASQHSEIDCRNNKNHASCQHRIKVDNISCNVNSSNPLCKKRLKEKNRKNIESKRVESCSPGNPGCSPKVEERLKMKITCTNGSPGPICNTKINSKVIKGECSVEEYNCIGGIRCYHGRDHVNCRKTDHKKGTVVNCFTHPFHYTCLREKELRGNIPPHKNKESSKPKISRWTTEIPRQPTKSSTLPTSITTPKFKKPPCFPGSTDPTCSLYHLGHLCIREPTNPKCQPVKPIKVTTDKDPRESKKILSVTSTTSKPEKRGKQLTKKKMPKDDFHGDVSPRYHAFHSWLYKPAPRPRNRGIRGRRSIGSDINRI